MDIIELTKINEVYYHVKCEDSISYELYDYFSFYVKNYKFMPKYKAGTWDGKVRLYNMRDRRFYIGLFYKLISFCKSRNYKLIINEGEDTSFDVKTYDPPFTPYDYQTKAIDVILNKKRRLVLSPTSSGKSYIIYGAIRNLVEIDKKVLLVTPTTSLVEQIYKDFIDYGWDAQNHCHMIYSGKEKKNTDNVVISTWQSLYKLPKWWFDDFDAVFVDEAHLAGAESIKSIMEKTENAAWRVGLTGTIDDTQAHKLMLEALFGKVYSTVKTKELMDQGLVTSLKINAVILDHPKDDKKLVSKMKYSDEIGVIVQNRKRNKFICNLAISQKHNTLILFNYVDKHGKVLLELFKNMSHQKQVFFISGETPVQEREEIRRLTENSGKIQLTFGKKELFLDKNEIVTLSNGKKKKASEISTEDDISDEWLETKFV
jgi:superfamily II DNA or RNA helicase